MQRELVLQAMQGDRDAFCALAARDLAQLTGAARLILHDAGWAEDAVQDALIRAWRDLPALRDPDRYGAWLHRLLVRSCQDQLRRHRRDRRDEALTWRHDRPSPETRSGFDDRDELERGLRRLNPPQRTLIALAYYLQLTHREISEATGLPIGTVKSRLSRSLELLRAELAAAERAIAEEPMS